MDKELAAHLRDVRAKSAAFMPSVGLAAVWAVIEPILQTVGKQAAIQLLTEVMSRVQKWGEPS